MQHWQNILEHKSAAMLTAAVSTRSVDVNAILVDVEKRFVLTSEVRHVHESAGTRQCTYAIVNSP